MSESPITQLVELIGFDLDHMDRTVARSGWSHWANLGALASGMWAVFAILDSSSANMETSLGLAVGLAGVVYGVSLALSMLNEPAQGSGRDARFRFIRAEYTSVRVPVAILVGLTVLKAWILIAVPTHVSPFIRLTAIVLVAGEILLYVGILIVSYTNMPCPQAPLKVNSKAKVLIIVVAAAFAWSGFCIAVSAVQHDWRANVVSIKLAALINAIAYLSFRIAHPGSRAMFEDSLIDLRRELMTNQINYDEAIKRYMTIRAGMIVDDILHKYVAGVVAALSQVELGYREQLEAVRTMKHVIAEGCDVDTRKALLLLVRQKVYKTNNQLEMLEKEKRKFLNISQALVAADKTCGDDVAAVRSGLDSQMTSWNAKIRELGVEVTTLLEEAEQILDVQSTRNP